MVNSGKEDGLEKWHEKTLKCSILDLGGSHVFIQI